MSDNYLLHHWAPLKGCWSIGQSTTIHDRETWEFLQNAYRRAVPPGTSSIVTEPTTGMMVPYEVRLIPDKGRGLFATKDIKKGEVVWEDILTGKFTDELSWRRFVSSIPYELACEVYKWSYVLYDKKSGKTLVHLDLDDASFTNTADDDDEGPNSTNGELSIALRDIKAGEEITMSYSGLTDNIGWYKKMKRLAWKKDRKKSSPCQSTSNKEEGAEKSNEEILKKEETVTHSSMPVLDGDVEDVPDLVARQDDDDSSDEDDDEDDDDDEDYDDNTTHGSHAAAGLIKTTALRKNAINTNQRLTLNELGLGGGGSADSDQQHGWHYRLFFVFPLIMLWLWYCWKKTRHGYGFALQKCRQKRYSA